MDRKLIDYLPEHSQEILEMRVIMAAEQKEFERLWTEINNTKKDQFLVTATENGIARWEKMLKISPKATDTTEERRLRILAKVNEQLPFTKVTLAQSLTALCGEGGYKMDIRYGEYRVRVLVALAAKKMVDEVQKLLQRVLPANLLIEVTLLYNTWEKTKAKTWGELLSRKWRGVKEDE